MLFVRERKSIEKRYVRVDNSHNLHENAIANFVEYPYNILWILRTVIGMVLL